MKLQNEFRILFDTIFVLKRYQCSPPPSLSLLLTSKPKRDLFITQIFALIERKARRISNFCSFLLEIDICFHPYSFNISSNTSILKCPLSFQKYQGFKQAYGFKCILGNFLLKTLEKHSYVVICKYLIFIY